MIMLTVKIGRELRQVATSPPCAPTMIFDPWRAEREISLLGFYASSNPTRNRDVLHSECAASVPCGDMPLLVELGIMFSETKAEAISRLPERLIRQHF